MLLTSFGKYARLVWVCPAVRDSVSVQRQLVPTSECQKIMIFRILAPQWLLHLLRLQNPLKNTVHGPPEIIWFFILQFQPPQR